MFARQADDIQMINLGEAGYKKMITAYRDSITDDSGTRILIHARINKSCKLIYNTPIIFEYEWFMSLS